MKRTYYKNYFFIITFFSVAFFMFWNMYEQLTFRRCNL